MAPLRMEHEMDEEEEVAVALGRQVEGGSSLTIPGRGGNEQTNEGPPGLPAVVGGSKRGRECTFEL